MRGPQWSSSSSTHGRNRIPASPFPCTKLPKHTQPSGAPGLQPGLPFSCCLRPTFHCHCLSRFPPTSWGGSLPLCRCSRTHPPPFPGGTQWNTTPEEPRPWAEPDSQGSLITQAKSVMLRVCSGTEVHPGPSPSAASAEDGNRLLGRVRATGGSPASRAVPTRGRQLGKTDGPSPAGAVEQGGSCHRELHIPGWKGP